MREQLSLKIALNAKDTLWFLYFNFHGKAVLQASIFLQNDLAVKFEVVRKHKGVTWILWIALVTGWALFCWEDYCIAMDLNDQIKLKEKWMLNLLAFSRTLVSRATPKNTSNFKISTFKNGNELMSELRVVMCDTTGFKVVFLAKKKKKIQPVFLSPNTLFKKSLFFTAWCS